MVLMFHIVTFPPRHRLNNAFNRIKHSPPEGDQEAMEFCLVDRLVGALLILYGLRESSGSVVGPLHDTLHLFNVFFHVCADLAVHTVLQLVTFQHALPCRIVVFYFLFYMLGP